MKVFSIVFHPKNGVIFSTDRHEECWILLFEKTYGRLTKVDDDNEHIANGCMMKLSELRQEHEIDPCSIVQIPNVLWHLRAALSVYQRRSSYLPPIEQICLSIPE